VTDRLHAWVDHGATHVSLNTLEAGYAWPDEHFEVCCQVGHLWREALDAR
jgi:hypothetical protein